MVFRAVDPGSISVRACERSRTRDGIAPVPAPIKFIRLSRRFKTEITVSCGRLNAFLQISPVVLHELFTEAFTVYNGRNL